MIGKRWILVVLVLGTLLPATAQKIVYSEPGKDDTRRLVFEIAGKVGGNFLIYKNNTYDILLKGLLYHLVF